VGDPEPDAEHGRKIRIRHKRSESRLATLTCSVVYWGGILFGLENQGPKLSANSIIIIYYCHQGGFFYETTQTLPISQVLLHLAD
jgi:hypothetical protein